MSNETQTLYQATPDIYEHDLNIVIKTIQGINLAFDRVEDVWLESGELILWSSNDYPIGCLRFVEDQWVFTPHNDSQIPNTQQER